MAGQNVKIPNVDEATGFMHRQSQQISQLLEDMLKTKSALSGVNLEEAGGIGQTAVDYVNQMIDALQKMENINAQNMKQFNQFVGALAEVDQADFKLTV